MKDFGFPLDTIELIDNIYAESSTLIKSAHFSTTSPIQISQGIIQGDNLNP